MFESDNWEDFPLREGDYVTGHSLNNENDDDNQCVTMKTHGSIWRDLLLLILFSTTLKLCLSHYQSLQPTTLYWEESFLVSSKSSPGKKRRVKQESDWKRYYGSCDELKEDVKLLGTHMFKREILSLHKTKGKTNFAETEALFKNNVLGVHGGRVSPLLQFQHHEPLLQKGLLHGLDRGVRVWVR